MKLKSFIVATILALMMVACGNESTPTIETNDSEINLTDTLVEDSIVEVEDTTL
jgi:uncharacterized lipoprotein YehR (DUF1307 family)